ncbi:SAM-dependent methyltransferase [Actinoplanes sp. NPDC051513]|uniref:SAM-dependent methyltransferase n=1 Tax=Actinoplanes sp. NPDC051513 TaxID=3363908 RepID=UPI0037920BBD
MGEIDSSAPHPARRYNYWLGGEDHFAADRESGDAIARAFPVVVELARANRAFQRRCVDHLAGLGIGQFLDVGTGLPAPDNTHEVAQRRNPGARVVYVDNDPIVATRAAALMDGGRTAYLEADLRDPAAILGHPALRETLDLDRPVALLLVAVLHFMHDDNQVAYAVRTLMDALPAGSYLAISHGTMDFSTKAGVEAYEKMFAEGRTDVRARPRPVIRGLFEGTEIVEPGIVRVGSWRAPAAKMPSADLEILAAVGRKL